MKGSFREAISASIEWTKTVLFRPFSLKKWVLIYIVAFLAFQMQGGCNSNVNFKADRGREDVSIETVKQTFKIDDLSAAVKRTTSKMGRFATGLVLSGVLALILGLFILLQWLYSVFSFIFIDSIVNNDASIKEPFRRNRRLGNSYFGWNLIYLIVLFGLLGFLAKFGYDSLARSGVFRGGAGVTIGVIMKSIAPFLLLGIPISIAGGFLSFFVTDYVLIVMYKEKFSLMKAMPVALSLLLSDFGAFIKYLFVKIGLGFLTAIIGAVIMVFVTLGLLIPAGLTALAIVMLLKITPPGARAPMTAILAAVGIPVAAVFLFLVGSVLLPFPVFMKTFNIKFIARVNERYNLFKFSGQEGQHELRKPS